MAKPRSVEELFVGRHFGSGAKLPEDMHLSLGRSSISELTLHSKWRAQLHL